MTDDAPEKCPCCNNPWAAATGDLFANMMCGVCEVETKEVQGFSRSNMDLDTKPHNNFYRYSNGGWIEKNPIPAEYPTWNTFLSLHVKSQENIRELLSELKADVDQAASATGGAVLSEQAKVASFYAAALDEETIEASGTEQMKPLLDLCDAAVAAFQSKNNQDFAKCIGQLDALYGVSPFFDIGVSPDNKNSDHGLCQVSQGGIGLPDRDYYFDEDKEDKRDAYKKHLAKMLTMLAVATSSPAEEHHEPTEEMMDVVANQVYALEVKLAEAHMTKTENRDPEVTYNKMSVAEFSSNCGGTFDYSSFFLGATGKNTEELGDINIRNTAALERVSLVLNTNAHDDGNDPLDPQVLSQFLRWHAVSSCASYLSSAFVTERFDFYEKILTGTAEIKPRWKRAIAFTETALGEALGQLYCAKYFDELCKGRALDIVENVRRALEERLREVEWMSESTREAGMKKMAGFKVKIGYPDKWIDYTSLDIQKEEPFLAMVFKSRAFGHQLTVKEMNAPTDRDKWFLTPQTVNAYYHPSLNEIVFPAAILQAPFFNGEADDAINYGAMGAVVGHEMTHAFDDKGRKFNSDGNMIDWWTEEDATEYEKRVQVMVEQADSYQVHGQSVQGKLTCGENIADLGGLRLAYRALKAQKGFDDAPLVDGFTPTQRFFLGWSQCWRQNVTKERALQLLTLDPHGPNEMRCNGPLSNIPEFLEAFDIPEDSEMFRSKQSRVDIW